MCRNIKTLYNFEPPASKEEIEAAALQYVRKISGFQKPSQVNQAVFARAIERIANATEELCSNLQTAADPKNRAVEAEKARERNLLRFGK
jgi:hypothetical protein